MNWLRFRAVARKEFIHIRRDWRSLVGAIAIPVLLLFSLGYGLSLDVNSVRLAVWDQSRTPASRELIQQFIGSPYFVLDGYAGSQAELQGTLDRSEALIALVIPQTFASDLEAGHPVEVQVLADGSDTNSASLAIGYTELVVRHYSKTLTLKALERAGAGALRPAVELQPRVWFNPGLESRNYLLPGLIAIIMVTIAALLTSLTITREWERGTMERLICTPVTGPELLLGKLAPYFVIGLFDIALSVLMCRFLFQVPLRGSVGLLFLLASVFLIGALALGMLISITTRSQLVANQQAIIFTFLPAVVLSGFLFATSNMPLIIQGLTYVIPARYFVTILKDIFLKGVGPEIVWLEATVLSVIAVAFLYFANAHFRKQLD